MTFTEIEKHKVGHRSLIYTWLIGEFSELT